MAEAMPSRRPIPSASVLTLPYWQAVAHHVLAVQECASCRHLVHPPRAECPECRGSSLAFTEVSGRGTIETFTVVHRTFAPGFADRLPYVIAWVELVEQRGLRVLSNLIDTDPDSLLIGDAVEVVFDDLEDFGPIPQFRTTRNR